MSAANHSVTVAVGAVVLHGEADDLMLCLIKRGTPPAVGSWSLPGGKVEFGESLAKAIAREVHEEAGLQVQVGDLIEVVELLGVGHHYVVHDFLCVYDGPIERLSAGDDAQDARWVRHQDLHGYQLTDAVLRVIRRAVAAFRGES